LQLLLDSLLRQLESFVIPAKAGIQYPNLLDNFWIPAFAGMTNLGAWAAEGIAAKSDRSEGSFCRLCSPIAVAMGQKDGEKCTAAVALQPMFLLPPRLLAIARCVDLIRSSL